MLFSRVGRLACGSLHAASRSNNVLPSGSFLVASASWHLPHLSVNTWRPCSRKAASLGEEAGDCAPEERGTKKRASETAARASGPAQRRDHCSTGKRCRDMVHHLR